MNDCRRVIFCIFTNERITDNGFAQESFCVSLTDSLVNGILNRCALKMDVLSDFQKDHCHSGVLTDRNHLLVRNL